MTVPYAFSAATSAIPLSQLDDNFNTTITLGNTAIQLGNTVTTLNNMTLANVTISSGNVTITNVSVSTANVTTGNITNLISSNVALTGGAISNTTLGAATASTANVTTLTTSSTVTLNGGTANGVAYLNGSKVLTTGSALTFDGTNLSNAGRYIVTANSAGVTDVSYGRYSNGAWINTPSATVGYLAIAGGSAFAWDSSNLISYIGGTEQMRLTSTGLGIGTSSPAAKLDVNGTAAISGAVTLSGGTANGVLYLNGSKVATSGSALTFDGTTLALNANQTFDNARVLQWKNTSGVTRPVLQIFSDNNLYIDSEDGSQIFRTGGSEQMRLTSTGLGIGTSSPAAKLQVSGGNIRLDNNQGLEWGGGNNFIYGNEATDFVAIATNGSERARIDSSGNLLVGQTSASFASGGGINVKNASTSNVRIIGGSSTGFDLSQDTGGNTYVYNRDNGFMAFATNNTERARITSGGYFKASDNGTYVGVADATHEFRQTVNNNALAVSATNASYTSTVFRGIVSRAASTAFDFEYHTANAVLQWQVRGDGNAYNVNGTYGTISDAKMKTDIVDAGSQWADIKAIRFRKFKMKDDPSGLLQLGVVAQELEQTSPGLVDEHTDRDAEGNDLGTTTKSVKTSVLLMKAAVALQEAMARIEKLEAEVATLKGA